MGLITDSLVFDLVAILTTAIVGLIWYLKWHFQYWTRVGLPTLSPTVPFGDAKDFLLGKRTMGQEFREMYNKFKKRGLKHGGVYLGPQQFYLAMDVETVKNIMTRDFGHFMNHGNFVNEKDDPLSAHLFNLEDQKWRNMRVKLTPTFTSGKMKMMFQTLADCAVGLKDIMQESALNHTPADIKDILARFSTDIIGSCAFGLECNSLKNPNAEFREFGRKVFEANMERRLRIIALFALPPRVLQLFRFKLTRRDVEEFFTKAIRDTVNYREKNNVYRKDFLHLLLQLKNRGKVTDDDKIVDEHGSTEERALTMNELYAQAFVFFVAGFETSSTTMTWALFELAQNPNVQEELRKEINSVLEKHEGKITYEGVMEMHYMEKVINETLRKYPPVSVLTRKCNKEYIIPGTSYKLEKDVKVAIPVLALHTDPEFYPNPEKFDPERFSEENKKSRPDFTWLPFGEGPRLCIGLRFGMLQTKVGLATMLKNYDLKLSSKTKLPLKLDPSTFITSAKDGIWLDVEKLD